MEQAHEAKLQIQKHGQPGVTMLRFSGVIDESFDGDRLSKGLDGQLVIAMADVRRITSFGSDGVRLLLSAADPFGRLTRDHLLGGVHRALTQGTMDRQGGGAGLGFFVIFNSSSLIFVDILPGRLSQVTSILELDVPQREQRTLPKSIHLFNKGS